MTSSAFSNRSQAANTAIDPLSHRYEAPAAEGSEVAEAQETDEKYQSMINHSSI